MSDVLAGTALHAEKRTACKAEPGRQPTQPSRVLLADSGAAAPQCGQPSLAYVANAGSQSKANG
jgi:hypothetical protein